MRRDRKKISYSPNFSLATIRYFCDLKGCFGQVREFPNVSAPRQQKSRKKPLEEPKTGQTANGGSLS